MNLICNRIHLRCKICVSFQYEKEKRKKITTINQQNPHLQFVSSRFIPWNSNSSRRHVCQTLRIPSSSLKTTVARKKEKKVWRFETVKDFPAHRQHLLSVSTIRKQRRDTQQVKKQPAEGSRLARDCRVTRAYFFRNQAAGTRRTRSQYLIITARAGDFLSKRHRGCFYLGPWWRRRRPPGKAIISPSVWVWAFD